MLRVRPNTILDPEKARRGIEEAKKLVREEGLPRRRHQLRNRRRWARTRSTSPSWSTRASRSASTTIEFEGNQAFSDRQLARSCRPRSSWILSFVTGAGNLDREVLKTDIGAPDRLLLRQRLHRRARRRAEGRARRGRPQGHDQDRRGRSATSSATSASAARRSPTDAAADARRRRRARRSSRASCARTSTPLDRDYGDLGYAFVNVTPETDIDPADKTRRRHLPGHPRPRGLHRSHRDQRQHQDARQGHPPRARAAGAGAVLGHRAAAQPGTAAPSRLLRGRQHHHPQGRERGPPRRHRRREARAAPAPSPPAPASARANRSSSTSGCPRSTCSAAASAIVFNADFGIDPPQHHPQLHRAVFPRHAADRSASTPSTGSSSSTTSPAAAPAAASAHSIRFRPSASTSSASVRSGRSRCSIRGSGSSTASRTPRSPTSTAAPPAIIRAEAGTSLTSSHHPAHLPRHPQQPVRPDRRLVAGRLGRDRRPRRRQRVHQGRGARALVHPGLEHRRARRADRLRDRLESSATGSATATSPSCRCSSATSPAASTPSAASRSARSGRATTSFRTRPATRTAARSAPRPTSARVCVRSDVIGGSQQLVVNNEIIFPIVASRSGLKGVVFFDAGNAFLAADGYRLRRHARVGRRRHPLAVAARAAAHRDRLPAQRADRRPDPDTSSFPLADRREKDGRQGGREHENVRDRGAGAAAGAGVGARRQGRGPAQDRLRRSAARAERVGRRQDRRRSTSSSRSTACRSI